MLNNFEKQVGRKMEELKLVPSEPVWLNIEKQIRMKKERRRLVIWIPLFLVLLTGSGLWFYTSRVNEHAANVEITPAETGKEKKSENAAVTIFKEGSVKVKDDEPSSAQVYSKSSMLTEGHNEIDKKPLVVKIHRRGNIRHHEILSKGNAFLNTQNFTENEMITSGPTSKRSASENPLKPETGSGTDSTADSVTVLDSAVKVVVNPGETVTVNVAGKIKKSSGKWKHGIIAGTGVSGEGNTISLGGSARMELSNTAPSAGSGVLPASSVKNNFSFSAGLLVKRSVSKRAAIVSGLVYHYYSTERTIGGSSPSGTLSDRPAYFNNSTQGVINYNNQHHFIALPVLFDVQVLNQVPVHVQAGLSFQQLLSTKSVQYDRNSNLYFSDSEGLAKTQFISSLGLGYSFKMKNNSLLFGPTIQYGINSLNKKENKHLYSIGVHAQFIFGK